VARRRAFAWVVMVGTRVHLVRGVDEAHALDRIQARYGAAWPLRPDDLRIRLATADDLDLARYVDGSDDDLTRWRNAVTAQTA
jgi:hypothetical protein